MDIVSGFSSVSYQNREVNSVLVIVDLFSSRCHFYPIPSTFSGVNLGQLLYERYFPLHGIPEIVQSDQDPQFTSKIFKTLLENFNIENRTSVTAHHRSNGKVERYE
jgi:transposase InsO family protein